MIKEFQLKNGLSVLFAETHRAPVVTVQMWVRVGSADEGLRQDGLSHFIEHLLFKGTEKFRVGEIAALVESSGGEINAYTSFDQTVYHVTLSKDFFEVGAEIIEEMICRPLFDQKEVDNEREVVLEEIKRSRDNPNDFASRMLFSNAFKRHPYRLPVIGSEKTIKSAKTAFIKKYFETHYTPQNMRLVVVGDFNSKVIASQIQKRFGTLKRVKSPKGKRSRELEQRTPRIAVAGHPFEMAQIHMAWKIPQLVHRDIAALDALASVFGQGDSSRLIKRLRISEPLVNSIGCGTFNPRDPGLFVVSLSFDLEKLEPILQALTEEFERLHRELPLQEELDRVVVNMESEQYYGLETVEGYAQRLGYFSMLAGDYDYYKTFLHQLSKVSIQDLVRVHKKYLDPGRLTLTASIPTKSKGNSVLATIRKRLKTFVKQTQWTTNKRVVVGRSQSSLERKSLTKIKTSGASGPPTKHVLKNGITLLFRPNSETAVSSFRLVLLGGQRIEPANRSGLGELAGRVWACETKELSETALYKKLDSMAAQISSFSGRNTIGLTMDFLTPFYEEIIPIFIDIMKSPSFNKNIIDREREVMYQGIKLFDDNPTQVTLHNFMKSLFKNHPYERRQLGNPSDLANINQAEVISFWKSHLCDRNLVLACSGNIDREKIIKDFSGAAEEIPEGQRNNQRIPLAPLANDTRVFSKLERQQTHIVVGFNGLCIDSTDRNVLKILSSILSGQGGRLFVELRDKASLAYSVSPLSLEGIDGGYFGIYIGCSPDKGERAIAMIENEIKKLMKFRVSEIELARAKKYLVGRHDIELQTNRAISSSMAFDEIYGNPFDDYLRFSGSIQEVTAQRVMDLANRLFSQPKVTSAVGPSQPW